MRRAVFLDRDGTIVADREGGLLAIDELRLIRGAASAIRVLNGLGYLAIVVTNQANIGRGILAPGTLEEIHAQFMHRLRRSGAELNAIYHCPHAPGQTLDGRKVPACKCRKPEIGMLRRAVREHAIDLGQSWIVGDSTADMLAGKRMGIKTILVKTGHGGKDGMWEAAPDFVAPTLRDAIRIIRKYAR